MFPHHSQERHLSQIAEMNTREGADYARQLHIMKRRQALAGSCWAAILWAVGRW